MGPSSACTCTSVSYMIGRSQLGGGGGGVGGWVGIRMYTAFVGCAYLDKPYVRIHILIRIHVGN